MDHPYLPADCHVYRSVQNVQKIIGGQIPQATFSTIQRLPTLPTDRLSRSAHLSFSLGNQCFLKSHRVLFTQTVKASQSVGILCESETHLACIHFSHLLHHSKAPLIPRATGASVLVSVTCNDNVDVTEPCHALCHASGAQSLGQVICAILNL